VVQPLLSGSNRFPETMRNPADAHGGKVSCVRKDNSKSDGFPTTYIFLGKRQTTVGVAVSDGTTFDRQPDCRPTAANFLMPLVKSEPAGKIPPPASALVMRCNRCRLNLPDNGRIHVTAKRGIAQGSTNSVEFLAGCGRHAGNHQSRQQSTHGNKLSCFHKASRSTND